jgi:hypothetical protein
MGDIDIDRIIQEYQDRQNAGEPEPFDSFLPTPPATTTTKPMGYPGFIPNENMVLYTNLEHGPVRTPVVKNTSHCNT